MKMMIADPIELLLRDSRAKPQPVKKEKEINL
jgi:hypothetical protein